MTKISWLMFAETPESCVGGGTTYLLSLIREKYKVTKIIGGFFVLNDSDLWHKFAVLSYVGGFIVDGGVELTEGACVFNGEGPSGNLRECRHTFWGQEDDGYIFYPDGRLITAAFACLSEFYDNMVENKKAPQGRLEGEENV